MNYSGPISAFLPRLYGSEPSILSRQSQRWHALVEEFQRRFGTEGIRFFSTPGRTEIGGNHTDHNHGKVLAAAVDLDSIAAATAAPEGRITIYSDGYHQPFVVNLDGLEPVSAERGTTAALIRGIASRFRQQGYAIGGFRACIASNVPVGSGLSSSASIEVLLATILNVLFNDGRVESKEIALISQYAENVFFGKPCGLMDQIACAVGGIVKIDFNEPESPLVENLDFDFASAGYSLLVVDTGGSHADLTEEYASIPREMKSVAAFFGREFCRQISESELLGSLAPLRARVGDRAVLRALHFLKENQRVDSQVDALRRKDLAGFFRLIEGSGASSYRWLQNCISARSGAEQGIPLALALAEECIGRWGGACRVHGGGFAGTILAFIPHHAVAEFRTVMESAFDAGCVKILRVRAQGSLEIM